ncbi:GSCFA domain-containing protein [Flavobacteriaceae bacterium D16]|nr:GSCFA domain-containing protein [Flavobacteriaceae bacterium D16]
MQLQTKISLFQESPAISYGSKTLLLGSCFAEHIGDKLEYYQFPNCLNPLGIFFHPKAIEMFLERLVQERPFSSADVFMREDQWHSFEAHSRVSQSSEKTLLKVLNDQLQKTHDALSEATHIFLTLGSAWGYRLKETGNWVANCHKVPQKQFSKELWEVKDLEVCLGNILDMVQSINPEAQLVFTVSPVRHLKDGFIENQRSKAHLITAVHKLVDAGRAGYFPAYELMIDELRDYRFYGTDLVHPNKLAIAYIWEKFSQVWIAEEAHEDMQEVEAIRKGLSHRPFNKSGQAHLKFVEGLNKRIVKLQERYPYMSFEN